MVVPEPARQNDFGRKSFDGVPHHPVGASRSLRCVHRNGFSAARPTTVECPGRPVQAREDDIHPRSRCSSTRVGPAPPLERHVHQDRARSAVRHTNRATPSRTTPTATTNARTHRRVIPGPRPPTAPGRRAPGSGRHHRRAFPARRPTAPRADRTGSCPPRGSRGGHVLHGVQQTWSYHASWMSPAPPMSYVPPVGIFFHPSGPPPPIG